MYDPANHYLPKETAWSLSEARATINSIVGDAVIELSKDSGVPRHPMDDYGIKSDMYMGLSGLLWGIGYLKDIGATSTRFDPAERLEALLIANEKDYKEHTHHSNASYLFGQIPILMQQYKLSRDGKTADKIYAAIKINNDQPVRELMWGMAGTMLASVFMFHWSSEERWKEIFKEQAHLLLADLEEVEGVGHLWTQDLYGSKSKLLGPVHGFAGNLIPLIKGGDLLEEATYVDIAAKAMNTVANTAVQDDTHANWPAIYDPSTASPPRLVQHCHGAPGMVTSLSQLPQNLNLAFDQSLLKAGELVWDAGSLKKGANLCHGTAGNGYAFLNLYKRTGDEKWLDRARIFAMNAIEQYREMKQVFRQGRYTLWTGDIGTAIYLWDCITEDPKFPTVEVF